MQKSYLRSKKVAKRSILYKRSWKVSVFYGHRSGEIEQWYLTLHWYIFFGSMHSMFYQKAEWWDANFYINHFPIEQNHGLIHDMDGDLVDATVYRRLIVRYINQPITRPDIAYAVSVVSQFMEKPRKKNLDSVYRILLDIKESPGKGYHAIFRQHFSDNRIQLKNARS